MLYSILPAKIHIFHIYIYNTYNNPANARNKVQNAYITVIIRCYFDSDGLRSLRKYFISIFAITNARIQEQLFTKPTRADADAHYVVLYVRAKFYDRLCRLKYVQ